jgi:hypothetical protein
MDRSPSKAIAASEQQPELLWTTRSVPDSASSSTMETAEASQPADANTE